MSDEKKEVTNEELDELEDQAVEDNSKFKDELDRVDELGEDEKPGEEPEDGKSDYPVN